jgi:CheY-like chemotaxis protein
VVDGCSDAEQALASLIRRLGHHTETANDARTALAAAHRLRPDLIFLDITLPGDMDGYKIAEALRADSRFDRTLIVALTGPAAEHSDERARFAGIDVYLLKPGDTAFISSFVGDARSHVRTG